MKKLFAAAAVCSLGLLLCGSANAQLPSAKGSAAISKATLIEKTDMTHSWDPVLTTKIQVSEQKELSFDVALQCGLFTDTLVRSKGGERDTATAEAGIDVRVKLQRMNNNGTPDGLPFFAYPGGEKYGVTYAKRSQELMAKFQGIFQECEQYGEVADPVTGEVRQECVSYGTTTCLEAVPTDTDGDGVIDSYPVIVDLECLDYEEVRLALDTLNANAFNFVSANLDQGEYVVTVEAQITSSTTTQNGSAAAKGLIGMGSMTVDEVRFIKGDAGTGM